MTTRLVTPESLAAAMDEVDPDVFGGYDDEDNHAEHLSFAIDILAAIPPDPRLAKLLAAAAAIQKQVARDDDMAPPYHLIPVEAALLNALRDALAAFEERP